MYIKSLAFGLHSKRTSLRLHLHTGFLLFFALRIARARGTILRRPAPNWVRFVFQLRHSQRGALGRLATLKTLLSIAEPDTGAPAVLVDERTRALRPDPFSHLRRNAPPCSDLLERSSLRRTHQSILWVGSMISARRRTWRRARRRRPSPAAPDAPMATALAPSASALNTSLPLSMLTGIAWSLPMNWIRAYSKGD